MMIFVKVSSNDPIRKAECLKRLKSIFQTQNLGWYSLTWISKDQIKFEQKLSLFDQILGSAQIGIHETFELIF